MREMILNHASLAHTTRPEIDTWLKDIAASIAALVRSGAVRNVLRTDRPIYEIPCPEGRSLWEAWNALRHPKGRDRQCPEEVRFLGKLLQNAPFLEDTSSEPRGRLLSYDPVRCEAQTLPPSRLEFGPDERYDRDAGRPLVYCAISSGIAVSFPLERVWDGDRLTVVFDKVVRNGDIERAWEKIDNLSRSEDASGPCGKCLRGTSRE